VIGDITRVRQILVNLLDNAVKFTEKGKVVVSVWSKPLDNQEYELYFAIKDTGIGISQEWINYLFQPFTQVDASPTRRYGGTGLGLITSKQLAEKMNGRMWVKSKLGIGSTFFFTVVVTAVSIPNEFPTTLKPESTSFLSNDNLGRQHPLRILVAEDNVINQKVVLHMLERLGYDADVVRNGLEAVEALKQQSYDVILMDIQMPEMDGAEATRYIRNQWEAHAAPYIIALTANAITGDKEYYLTQGMDDYISKPVQLDNLVAALMKCAPKTGSSKLHQKSGHEE
jgi:CheY-like chemotaxis protein